MKKVHESICKAVNDVITMPRELNDLAREKTAEGYQVERGVAGTVIVKLDDGEIHFVPAAGCIKMIAFAY
ncbi:hypothetical protein SAMN05660649_04296 [Desulfotomaculum arcticum]|uniref:Uncharacterized protein n=1 Tax=Desulfotruncus arcticus DSM 17038 TaxID=1121424 RepID=A0A1I2Y851_9FIRM|nr:hypothetical protein [Desulfotruncus arcticus]SFH21802.1 hypothetical protein SAMN05660649_04296 [Desulfotomaculum arcticum] [Desulfotruncus arcticus DSM 17038]